MGLGGSQITDEKVKINKHFVKSKGAYRSTEVRCDPGIYTECNSERAILENVSGSNFVFSFLNETPVNYGRIHLIIPLQCYCESIFEL